MLPIKFFSFDNPKLHCKSPMFIYVQLHDLGGKSNFFFFPSVHPSSFFGERFRLSLQGANFGRGK